MKINIPENSEIKINGTDFINIINQALHEKEKSFWEKYWRELVVVIVTAVITTIINYFI